MAWTRKRIALTLGWLVSLAIANYVGGAIGFSQGYGTASALRADDAIMTTAALRFLRTDKTAEAISHLEGYLDAKIASDVFGEHSYHSVYNVYPRIVLGPGPVELDARFLSRVLEYREQYPPVTGNEADKASLMKALASYRNAPRPRPAQ